MSVTEIAHQPVTTGIAVEQSNAAAAKGIPQIRRLSISVRLLPIIFFLTYLNVTVILFAFGPWPWPITDGTKLYLFLALAHLALFVGYMSAAFRSPRQYTGRFKVEHLLMTSLILNLLLVLPTSQVRTGSLLPDFVEGLRNPGVMYSAAVSRRAEGGTLLEYIRLALGPLLYLLFPLTVFFWRQLRTRFRILSMLVIGLYLLIYVATGTNKALADFVLLTPCLIVASHFAGVNKLRWKHVLRLAVALVVLLSLFLAFFTSGQLSRTGSGAAQSYFAPTRMYADLDNVFVRAYPPEVKVGVIALITYITQGYFGLYLSLDKPFIPMFGVGNSIFLYRNAARILGNSGIEEMPYPVRIVEDGWDPYGLWSSIYPWIASDVSFPGTVLVVFMIGRLFALCWLDTIAYRNPFAIACFAQFATMLFYFSANNQVLQSGEALTSFFGLLALWLLTRRKPLRKKASD